MGLGDLLLCIDMFGKKATFLVGEYRGFNTYLGAVLTLLTVLGGLFFILYFGIQVIDRKNQSLIVTTLVEDNPDRINWTDSNFALGIGLEFPNYTLYADESIYTIEAYLVTMTRKEDGEETVKTRKEIIRCDQFNFTVIPDYYKLLDLKNLYCLKPDDLNVEGNFGHPVWTYISLEFIKCTSESELRTGTKCKSKEDIEKRLSGGYIALFASDHSIIPNNYKEPAKLYGKNFFTSYSSERYIDFWVYYKKMQIVTDKGLLFQSKEVKEVYGYDYTRENTDNRVNDNFLTVKLRLSETKEVYERSYDKIQNVAANAGGIIQIFLIAGEVLTFLVREILYRDYISSYFFRKNSSILNCRHQKTQNLSKVQLSTTANQTNQINSTIKNNKSSSVVGPPSGDNSLIDERDGGRVKIYQSGSRVSANQSMFSRNEAEVVRINEKDRLGINNKTKLNSCNIYCVLLCNRHIFKKIKDANDLYNKMKYLLDIKYFLKTNEELITFKKMSKEEGQKKVFGLRSSQLFGYTGYKKALQGTNTVMN